jgi:hypothetical protein
VLVDALDDALTVFAATAPSYGRLGLANHGPMAAEALDRLGRADAIEGWVARYRPRLDDAPPPAAPLADDTWPDALGDEARYPEWLALFEHELADRPPGVVVGEWVPRLLPGTIGAATHGLIRTGHALRGLGIADTPPRRLELAAGLAFWGSTYQELPGPPVIIGHQQVPEALAALPYLPDDAPRQLLISDMVAHVADIAGEFEQGVSSLAGGGGATELLDQLATGGALAYLRNADGGGAIGLLHSVTSPWPPSSYCPGSRRRTVMPRSATPGRRWRPCTSPTRSIATDPLPPEARRRSRPWWTWQSPPETSTPSS